MSTGAKLYWPDARDLGAEVAEVLAPTVQRLKAVGSLRRGVMNVGDIEFVAEPFFNEDLFDGPAVPVLDPLRRALREVGEWVKGGDRMMQVTNAGGREGFKVEVFIVHPPAQWGSIVAIRTGPRDLGQWCVSAMRKRGYRHVDGYVKRLDGGGVIPTPEEADFFELAGVDMMPPRKRDEQIMILQQGKARP